MRFSFPPQPKPSIVTETIEIDPDISVAIGIPAHAQMPVDTVLSIAETLAMLGAMKIKHQPLLHKSNVVTLARDAVLERFLNGGCQKLFWIDSDMVWDRQAFFTMLALSQKVDVVCAAYPAKTEGNGTFFVNCEANRKIGPYGLQEFNGAGLGFTIVDRKVCQQLSDNAPKVFDQMAGRYVPSVFRIDVDEKGTRRTEDMAFFRDIQELGHTVWCKTDIVLGHIGERMWVGSLQQALDKGNLVQPAKQPA